MKIFYAIQATGNGHIARAMELMPYLQQYGQVDIFLSGSNSNLAFDLPVKYRSKGVSLFYGNKGGLDYWKMLKAFNPIRIWKEARALPVEQYDIVINDFESITSLACKLKQVPSVSFGHQASFQSKKTPRPQKKDIAGELVLTHYATANAYIGLHFSAYDTHIYNPIIKQEILSAKPTDEGYITVYMSHYSDEVIARQLAALPNYKFQVFSKTVKQVTVQDNISFIPVGSQAFNLSLIHCHGVITGAGFETPAEALYMGKKLLCMPIKGQYEQWCNAAALEKFNVPVVTSIDKNFTHHILQWLQAPAPQKLELQYSTYQLVQMVIETARNLYTPQPENSFFVAGQANTY